MARETMVIITDDLDGSKSAETLSYGLDGISYEIDLSAANAKRFRKMFHEFVDASRPADSETVAVETVVAAAPAENSAPRAKRGRPAKKATAARKKVPAAVTDGPDPSEVRAWAEANNKQVSKRGRLNADLISEFAAAHAS